MNIEKLLKQYWHLLLFNALLLAVFIIFYGRFGDINVDSFREAYIPSQMLTGQLLYKNIFNIYAPLSYYINAALFFLFGIKLKILYLAGFVASVCILNLVYKISNKFLPRIYGLGIVLFIIFAGIISANVFNYIFPYSFGILYGLAFILGSVYCALRNNFFLSYLLYSLAICSKYEFIFFLPILIWYSGKTNIIKNIIGFFIPITVVLSILFIQGVSTEDITVFWNIIIQMASTKTLNWFYTISGLTFRPEIILVYILSLIKIAFALILIQRYPNWFVYTFVTLFLYLFADPAIFIFFFPLIFIIFNFKIFKLKKVQTFIVLSCLVLSVKVFWGLLLQSYGNFFIPFGLIAMFILIPKIYKKSLLTVIIILSIVFGIKNSAGLLEKNTKVQTSTGVIYTTKEQGSALNGLIDYINTNVKSSERLVVYPEGLSVNFLSDRKSDNKFYSLIPLYVETFGEDLIIKRLDILKPEYIVISNFDTSNYYFSQFGKDYAGEVFNNILANYNKEAVFGNDFYFIVYKRN